jgi:hypothetical protein
VSKRLEWRRGDSWQWQLEWQLGLGKDTGPKDSWGGAAVALAGSRGAVLEGGLREAWASTPPSPQHMGGALLQPKASLRSTAGPRMTCGGRFPGQPQHPQADSGYLPPNPVLCLSLSGLPAEA